MAGESTAADVRKKLVVRGWCRCSAFCGGTLAVGEQRLNLAFEGGRRWWTEVRDVLSCGDAVAGLDSSRRRLVLMAACRDEQRWLAVSNAGGRFGQQGGGGV
ncbi:hypothetical protein Salat_1688500 [Sesamum alatum]|uniref:Uncharacterized protein n=1 Tax=Sesamum alatum TaxID=300844 RepID=A0AAE1Y7U0_9LAMI|nr:hypothetical protein Salat_1688500 [Sesamum alatum]